MNNIISIRKLKKSDKKYFAKWWRDNELLELTSGVMEKISDAELDEYFKLILESVDDLHFIIQLDRKVIGHVNLIKCSDEWYETQIIIGDREFRGSGYGPQAIKLLIGNAKNLGIKKIFLEVRPTNIRAIKAYEKSGFVGCEIIKYKDNKNLSEVLRMEYKR